ncbi:MAG: hypothetical protein IJB79_06445 [Candidatus Gastranaerophilales bacterium]|nr:hypothetical protein [Candidatus Gastranaerophilales bacterium]
MGLTVSSAAPSAAPAVSSTPAPSISNSQPSFSFSTETAGSVASSGFCIMA